jgi:hypothetical protein
LEGGFNNSSFDISKTRKMKPPKKPVVAFYNIKKEIYAKARERADEFAAEATSEEEDDDLDGDEIPYSSRQRPGARW